MLLLLVIGCLILLLFSSSLLFGAPYVPTLKPQVRTSLDLLDLKPGQTLLEIGSGDGRVLLAAAARGVQAVGYEINPLLVLVSIWRTRKHRALIRIIWGNALRADWPQAEGVYVFGIAKIMHRLHTKFVQYPHKPLRVVSYAFPVPGKQPIDQQSGLFLYQY